MSALTINQYGYTALLYAANKGYTKVVRALLEQPDINVNITCTKVLTTPFNTILISIRNFVTLHLLTFPFCAQQFGRTALMCAAKCGYVETVAALLTHKDIDTKVLSKVCV